MNTMVRIFTRIHIFVYRISTGKLGGNIWGFGILLLNTIGRKTGKKHTTPIFYYEENGAYVVSATFLGGHNHPAWFLNLQNKPNTSIEIRGKKIDVQAEIVEGDRRDELYAKFASQKNDFAEYEKKTERIIPVILLKPVE